MTVMDHEHRLTLPEEVLLLGWDDRKGRNQANTNLGGVLAGSTLLELVVSGAVSIVDKKVRALATTVDQPAVAPALEQIAGRERLRSVKGWVHHWNGRRFIRASILESLVQRGIVKRERNKILGIFPMERYPVIEQGRVEGVRARAVEILESDDTLTDERDAALGSLVGISGYWLIRRLVPKEMRRKARERAKALTKGDGVSSEVAAAIAEANAAVMGAVGAAAAVSSSS